MSQLDLSSLRRDEAPVLPRAPLGPRLLLGAVLLLALAVATTFAWPWLFPVRAVPMAAVRSAAATSGTGSQGTVAEAVGWVEADPFPTFVRPLVDGRIDELRVLEGAPVEAGTTVLATLQSAALLAARDRAETLVAERQAAHAAAEVAVATARAQLQQNGELRVALAESTAAAAEAAAKLATARGALPRLQAEQAAAEAALEAQRRLQAAGGTNDVALARATQAALAAAAAATAAGEELAATTTAHAAAAARLQLAHELHDTPVMLHNELRTAEAALASAAAALASARTELQIATRELGWTTVTAPRSGIVLKLLAAPGALAGPDAEPILSLYDRAQLRARIDVPLGSVRGIVPGMAVELRSEVTGARIVQGTVQRLQHESDLLKNTLQVKVGLQDAPDLWRPETLVRARFLGALTADAGTATTTFLVPKIAVRDGQVFVFDPQRGSARGVAVTTQGEQGDDLLVTGELSVAMRVVLVPVAEGEAIAEGSR